MISQEFWEEWKWIIVIVLALFTFGITIFFVVQLNRNDEYKDLLASGLIKIDLGVPEVETQYVPDREYFETFGTVALPEFYETYTQVSAIVDPNARFADESSQFTEEWMVTEANQALYDLADKYYQVYWGGQRVSPLYPLAIANCETGNRADRSITWSSLFPSKILPISMLYDADVTTVVSDPAVYNALSTEWSTRDRGAMQMSPTYGTGSKYFNDMMSGTESEKLAEVDTSKYSSWASGASTKSGDRFYAPDVCLRLSAANTDALERMLENEYVPVSDMQLVVMLAMYHHRSGIWSNANHDKSCGEWYSSGGAFEYSGKLASQGFVNSVRDYATLHPETFTITRDVAAQLYKDYFGESPTEYTDSKLVYTYPITVLYSYIKMNIMYSSLE